MRCSHDGAAGGLCKDANSHIGLGDAAARLLQDPLPDGLAGRLLAQIGSRGGLGTYARLLHSLKALVIVGRATARIAVPLCVELIHGPVANLLEAGSALGSLNKRTHAVVEHAVHVRVVVHDYGVQGDLITLWLLHFCDGQDSSR